MPIYIIERLLDPSEEDIADVLNLFKKIPGRTCSAANYLAYLEINWKLMVAIFVVRKAGKIVGFTQAEAPSLLDPTSAFLPFSCGGTECGHKRAQEAVELAIAWMRGFGAKKFKVDTVRRPEAFSRLWDMKRSKEVRMEKEI